MGALPPIPARRQATTSPWAQSIGQPSFLSRYENRATHDAATRTGRVDGALKEDLCLPCCGQHSFIKLISSCFLHLLFSSFSLLFFLSPSLRSWLDAGFCPCTNHVLHPCVIRLISFLATNSTRVARICRVRNSSNCSVS